jgi:hypothetical protein
MNSCLLVLLLASAPSQVGDSAPTTEIVDGSMTGDFGHSSDAGCESCESCSGDDEGGCKSCGGCKKGCGGCNEYGWIRRAGPMPQTCYNPRHGCYPGNNRFMHRYPAFHGYYYRNPYNYRTLFDYPWHAELHEPTSMFSYNFEESSSCTTSTPTEADPADSPTAKATSGAGTRRIAGYSRSTPASAVRQTSAQAASSQTARGSQANRAAQPGRPTQSTAATAKGQSPTPAATAEAPTPRFGGLFQGGLFRRGELQK